MSQAIVPTIGPADVADLNFVLSSWKKSFREAPKLAQLPAHVYYERANSEVAEILTRAEVLVARDSERPDFLYGFIAYEALDGAGERPDALCVQFVYTKRDWRRLGVASKLLSAAVTHAEALGVDLDSARLVYTHETRFNDVAERLGFRHVNQFRWAKDLKGGTK